MKYVTYYIVFSILLILALLGSLGAVYITNSGWKSFISNLSGTLIVGASLSILFKIFQDRENDHRLRELFRIHDSIDDLGLVEIYADSST